jgi:Carboxypeptidase regulatory-like domain
MPSISGNVGGTAGSGAVVVCRSYNGSVNLIGAADSSGNYTFSNLPDETKYSLTAALAGFTILNTENVHIRGGNNVSDVNFKISALNGYNTYPPPVVK